MNGFAVRDGLVELDSWLGLSRLLPDRRNAVLVYHSVGDQAEYGDISPDRLRRDLQYLADQYDVVDLPDVLDASGSKKVAVTFDDGHRNFFTNAIPVLREFDFPATVFVVADAIDDPDGLVNVTSTIGEAELREIVDDSRITVGNHTKTHPRLSAIDDGSRLREEIIGARRQLEDRFGITVNRFCFPSGDVSPESLQLVRESHDLAVTTVPRTIGPDVEPHRIPRISGHHPAERMRWELTDVNTYVSDAMTAIGRVWPSG